VGVSLSGVRDQCGYDGVVFVCVMSAIVLCGFHTELAFVSALLTLL
jgi:hypothetical protein